MSQTGRYAGIVASLSVLAATASYAAALSSVAYDPKTDELIVTMSYQGTNPDHQFSVQWGDCQTVGDDGNTHQIVGVVLDSQWKRRRPARIYQDRKIQPRRGELSACDADVAQRAAVRIHTADSLADEPSIAVCAGMWELQ
jgi:hypothetical protein